MVGLLALWDIPSSILWKKTLGLIQDSLANGNTTYVVPKFQGKKVLTVHLKLPLVLFRSCVLCLPLEIPLLILGSHLFDNTEF